MRTLPPTTALLVLLTIATVAAGQGPPCFDGAVCADGDLCNGIERCAAGECVKGPPLACDDADPCTRDLCEPAVGCVHVEDQCPASCVGLPNGVRCNDGTLCTRGDSCSEELCVPGGAPDCDDGDACTRDECDPRYGCVYREEAVGYPCVPDCNGGVADFTRCPGDGNVCTLDACLPSVDLISDPHICIVGLLGLERPCFDDDLCNGDEFCSPLLGCEPGPPLECDDGELCNGVESCDPTLGCRAGAHEPDGTACDDRRGCTTGDACSSGACVGSPVACDDGDAGTEDTCEEGLGCVHCQAAVIGKVGLRGIPGGRGRIAIRGSLPTLPAGRIAPASESVAIVVDAGTTPILRAVLPPGSLEANATGRRFLYRDQDAAIGGIRGVRVQDHGGAVRWRLAADLTLPSMSPGGVTVRLVIGDDCFRASATCSGSTRAVTCR